MRIRPSARLVLLDPDERVLLMKGRLPARPQGPGAWFTIGGGVESGESLEAAALREAREETGIDALRLGPRIWYGEVLFVPAQGENILMQDHYFLARAPRFDPARAGWTALENDLIDDIRWWTAAELRATQDVIYPLNFSVLLQNALETPGAHGVLRLPDRTVYL